MDGSQDHSLVGRLVLFGRMLRALGLGVTPEQSADFAAGLAYVDLKQREDVKAAARAMLVHHREHLPLFEAAFDLFWRDLGAHPFPPPPPMWPVGRERIRFNLGDSSGGDEPSEEAQPAYSAREVLRQKDFAELTSAELEEVKHLMQGLSWKLEQRWAQRQVHAARGTHFDMRRTFRNSLRIGEPIRLYWRRRQRKRRPLVVLCDISGSMERYARILLQFIYVMSGRLERVEAFVFSTRLTRITRQLQQRDIEAALDGAMGLIHDWAGGTRIGEVLRTFNYDWARRVLGQGAIVLIISDGWDRGDSVLLAREMVRLQRSAHRLVWLSPLLGWPDYEPLTAGIQAALPYVDDFLPAHNLASLEEIGALLEHLSERRPVRKQIPAN